MALKLGIHTYQILTNDDEVRIPSISSILLAVRYAPWPIDKNLPKLPVPIQPQLWPSEPQQKLGHHWRLSFRWLRIPATVHLNPSLKKVKIWRKTNYNNNKLFFVNTSNAHWVENADNHLKEEYKEENHKIEGAVVSESKIKKLNIIDIITVFP